jgi:hypothetical protein
VLPGPGELLHVSEDPAITRFVPRRAATQQVGGSYVWALDAEHAPCYWFPRACPRATAWTVGATTVHDARILGGAGRVHAVERRWTDAMGTTPVYAYRLPADRFRPIDPDDHYAFVCERTVEPLGPPGLLGDLVDLHARAGIELRMVDDLGPFWRAVRATSLAHSGIRLARADPAI